ncbi:MAG: DNA replication/repair protein RecF [Candidatus Krumholzibacteriota bacterium]|nr:DNA replication/repair protein RecF [Candidatus Krumholzibacteriota bacterium]
MVIDRIDTVCFRNIKKASLEFSESFNFISGSNAQGKTNLLEAIHFFSLGRSFRTRRYEELVQFGEEYFFLRLRGRSDTGIDIRLEAGYEKGGRIRGSVNGKRLSGIAEIIGIVPSVIFTAQDIEIASGPPGYRRTFLDYTAAQISPLFLSDLKEYRRVIRHRNSLLRRYAGNGDPRGELPAWDEMLVEKGAAIVKGREETLREISSRAARLYGQISPGAEELRLAYSCSFNAPGGDTREALREALENSRENERRRGYTLCGPQYDDILLTLGEAELRKYGSQGRRRLVAVILKLTQALTIMERRAERPVVLLDDIFSELDEETTVRVRKHLTDRYQSFITSPREDDFPEGKEKSARFRVLGGACERVAPI